MPKRPSCSSPRWASRISQAEKTGTRLLESRYDAIMENATASESGTKSWRPTPIIKNDGTKTARMQNIESRRAMAVRLHASTIGARPRNAGQHLAVDVFDFDGGLVYQHADGQRQAAEGHDVDGLAGGPQQDDGGEQGERDVQDDDQGAAPVAQKDEHHQAGESRAQQAFGDQAAQGIGDVGRLIELQADVDVFGHGFFEVRDGGFHRVDHGESGGVGALGDRNVDGALAVHVRVGGDQVGAVFDGADVAQIDGSAGHGADGGAQQIRQVGAQRGVGARDAFDLAGPHVAGRHDHARPADGGDGFFGRDAILAQLAGIERHHNGALVAAEGRRRGNSGQSREKRAHTVEGEILHLALASGRRC